MILKGTTMFACPEDDLAISEAKEYVKNMNLCGEDVKLIKIDGQIQVVARRDII